MHRGKTMCGHREKAAICKPRGEASEEIKPVDTLTLDLLASLTGRQQIPVI